MPRAFLHYYLVRDRTDPHTPASNEYWLFITPHPPVFDWETGRWDFASEHDAEVGTMVTIPANEVRAYLPPRYQLDLGTGVRFMFKLMSVLPGYTASISAEAPNGGND